MYKAEVAMTLEEKCEVLDHNEKVIQDRRESCYPNYSFVSITCYFQKEQVNFDLLYEQSKRKTLETIQQYCTRTHVPARELLAVLRSIIKNHLPKSSSRQLARHGVAVVPAEVLYTELSVDSIGYIFAVRSPKVCHGAGLTDIHSMDVLSKGSNGLGVCPWCGMAFSILTQLFAHIHREHYDIVLMCDVCHRYSSFDSEEMTEHIKKEHTANLGTSANS